MTSSRSKLFSVIATLWAVWAAIWVGFAIRGQLLLGAPLALICCLFAYGVYFQDQAVQRTSADLFLLAACCAPFALLAAVFGGSESQVRLLSILAGFYCLVLAWLGWRLRRIVGPPVVVHAPAPARIGPLTRVQVSVVRAGFGVWCVWAGLFAIAIFWRPPRSLVALPFVVACASCAIGVRRRRETALRVSAALFFFGFPILILVGPLNPFVTLDFHMSSLFASCYLAFWVTHVLALPWLGWHLDKLPSTS